MGTVGVLSYIPTSTQALAPLQTPNAAPTSTAHSQVLAGAGASASNGATKTTSTSTTTTGMRTIAGSTCQTQFGPVQVQIPLQGSKTIRARALQTPHGGLSSQIQSAGGSISESADPRHASGKRSRRIGGHLHKRRVGPLSHIRHRENLALTNEIGASTSPISQGSHRESSPFYAVRARGSSS
jgi:hypothetical protein